MRRRYTRILTEVEFFSYEENLDRVGLFSPVQEKPRGNLIEMFRITKGVNRADCQESLPLQRSGSIDFRGKVKGSEEI